MENGRLIDHKLIRADLCREKLDPKNAFFMRNFDRTSVSFTGDAELIVAFKESVPDTLSDMRYFLEIYTWATNTEARNYVDDPIISGETFKGRWRKAYVRELVRDISTSEQEHLVILTLRQGLASKINWDEARIVTRNTLPGNTQGSGDTASDNPERWLDILFPSFDPVYVESAVQGLADEYNSTGTAPNYTSAAFAVDGTGFYGEWHKVFARVQKQEDGTCNAVITMAQPQYTLVAFTDYGGDDAADVTYCWQVPKDIAQSILTAWKTGVGKSATAAYSMRDGLVDLVLRAKTTTGSTLTVTDLPLTCATDIDMYFAWGYTSAQVATFIGDHDSALTNTVRDIRISARGDGLYDVTITETSRTAKASNAYVYERLVPANDRYGYTDTVITFSGKSTADVEGYALGAGVYGWVRAKQDEDCTWKGEKVVRVYNTTPDATESNTITATNTDYLIRKIEFDKERANFRIYTYEVHVWFEVDYAVAWSRAWVQGEVYDFEDGSSGPHMPSHANTRYPFDGSGVNLIKVGNRSYWMATRVSAPRVTGWLPLAGLKTEFTDATNPNTKALAEAT